MKTYSNILATLAFFFCLRCPFLTFSNELESLVEEHIQQLSREELKKDVALLDKLIEEKPSEIDLRVLRCKSLVLLGERREENNKEIHKLFSEGVNVYDIWFYKNKPELALRFLNQILANRPDNSAALNLSFQIIQNNYSVSEIEKYYNNLSERQKEKIDVALVIVMHRFREDYKTSYQFLLKYPHERLTNSKKTRAFGELLAETAVNAGMYSNAMEHIQSLQKQYPDSIDYKIAEAILFTYNKEYATAKSRLDELEKECIGNGYWAYAQAFLSFMQGEFNDAIAYSYLAELEEEVKLSALIIRSDAEYRRGEILVSRQILENYCLYVVNGDAYNPFSPRNIFVRHRLKTDLPDKEMQKKYNYWGLGRTGGFFLKSAELPF